MLKWFLEEFATESPEIDEVALTDPDPFVTAQRIAKEKALAVYANHRDSLVVAGDTVVALPVDGKWEQLGKPKDVPDALRMLKLLSGKTHTVVTGVCLRWPRGMTAFTDATEVTFRKITVAEAKAYVKTGSPLDKAGTYGLQDESQSFVTEIRGSMTNVVGMPMERLDEALQDTMRTT